MRQLTFLAVSGTFLACSAFAQATRTWVSGVGDDANPCSRTAPCKTFAGAISKTAVGGEINVLDPGGFGAVTITKSLTLLAVGVPAGVLTSGTNGIVISNATGSTMNVTIRGLDIDGLGTSLSGISVTGSSPTNVHIENNQIYGFTNGVNVAASAAVNVTIVDTRVSECILGGAGILGDATGGPTSVSVIHSEVHNCATGLSLAGGAIVNTRDSDLSQNTTGVNVAGATTILTLDSDTIAFCTTAVNIATTGGTVRLTNDTIADNVSGLVAVRGGNLVSFGNNRITGNTSNGAPTATLVQN